ncbi:MAG TPA: hypothetical protein PK992_15500, partial [Planctomycetaceae bacterium]|nr:hypothetical protein [Planctomycetaceae bacterium]
RNTLLRRLQPPGILAGGSSLQGVTFQGWSPGTRIEFVSLAARLPLTMLKDADLRTDLPT